VIEAVRPDLDMVEYIRNTFEYSFGAIIKCKVERNHGRLSLDSREFLSNVGYGECQAATS
jgi:hypothetical protein